MKEDCLLGVIGLGMRSLISLIAISMIKHSGIVFFAAIFDLLFHLFKVSLVFIFAHLLETIHSGSNVTDYYTLWNQ